LLFFQSFGRTFAYLTVCSCLAVAQQNLPSHFSQEPAEVNPPPGRPLADAPSSGPADVPSPGVDITLWKLPVLRWFAPAAEGWLQSTVVSMLAPHSTCSVAALPGIDDPDALAFEAGVGTAGVIDTAGLTPATARALTRFQQAIKSAGGTLDLKSAYRPTAYQDHLQAVWDKWMMGLRHHLEKGCQALRAEVGEEFARHHLLEKQRPVSYSDHTRGVGFDAAVFIPSRARQRRHRVSMDRLALLAGVRRPDIRHDPVHFRLVLDR
jgi:D-alanyl-D-alanine carboxypeptidase